MSSFSNSIAWFGTGLTQNILDGATHSRREGQNRTSGPLARAGGFNLDYLAEPVRFEL